MISTVVRNLISNAIKFTNEGGKINVTALENGKAVEVSIEDSGIGMDEETLKKIFDPLAGYSTTGTKGEKGARLGLNLCKDFVERNKGKIWVESKVGKVSKFMFTLPNPDKLEITNNKLQISNKLQIPNTNDMKHYYIQKVWNFEH